jgi:hypothetical protein
MDSNHDLSISCTRDSEFINERKAAGNLSMISVAVKEYMPFSDAAISPARPCVYTPRREASEGFNP